MVTQRLNEFKKRHGIKSADKWSEICGVSKSTIVRALKGDHKDIGVYTLEQMLKPWGGSIDELLEIGAYSPEAIAKEEFKNEIVENLETVIDVVENSEEIPQETTDEIKEVLTAAQELIISEPSTEPKCVGCDALREIISRQDKEISSKNKWITKLFTANFILMVLLFIVVLVLEANMML